MPAPAKKYEGKALEIVQKKVSDVRIMKLDGEYKVGTREFQPGRLNVHVENGIVVHAYFG